MYSKIIKVPGYINKINYHDYGNQIGINCDINSVVLGTYSLKEFAKQRLCINRGLFVKQEYGDLYIFLKKDSDLFMEIINILGYIEYSIYSVEPIRIYQVFSRYNYNVEIYISIYKILFDK